MVKIFGFRVTPFFLFLLVLECLALFFSVYIGVILYKGLLVESTVETVNQTIGTGLVAIVMIAALTPGFFSQFRIVNRVKNLLEELMPGLIIAIVTMLSIVIFNFSSLDSGSLFLAAIFSVCIGMTINQIGILGRYWKFFVRTGVN